jgi:hypothetical protein
MKKLERVSITRLSHLEFGQHVKSIRDNITSGGELKKLVQDTVLLQYLDELNSKTAIYDQAMMQIAKSDETVKLAQADGLRDKALVSIQRYLNVFEHTSNQEQALAYASLKTLFRKYKGLKKWNYEEESNGLDSLIADLQGDKYGALATLIGMTDYVSKLQQSNDAFKTLFRGRTQEQSGKEIFNVKELKNDLKITYEKMVNYVLAMATALDNEEFNKSLSLINTVRKYYSDMLAKRGDGHKATTEIPIPSVN